jgi:hypothetical protein
VVPVTGVRRAETGIERFLRRNDVSPAEAYRLGWDAGHAAARRGEGPFPARPAAGDAVRSRGVITRPVRAEMRAW